MKFATYGQVALPGLLLLAALSFPARLRAEDATVEGVQAVVVTADDEQISGRIASFADNKLTIAGETPRSIDLTDLQRIEIGKSKVNTAGSDLAWIGQDNHDLVQVGGASGGNGIQDLHLHASNLKPQSIKQIAVVCRFPKQLRVWRLDTSKSPHWRLAIARADLSNEAELYLEPATLDSFEQKFEVTFTYNDDTTSAASVTATTHTTDQLKLDNSATPGHTQVAKAPIAATSKTIVYLGPSNDSQGTLHGDVTSLGGESLTLRADWQAELQIPLVRASGIWFGKPLGRLEFDKLMKSPAAEDVVLLLASDQSVAQVQGNVQSLADGKLSLRFEGADRAVKQDRLLGIVFATHPKTAPISTPFQIFQLASGDSISGQLVSLGTKDLEIETLWQTRAKLPTAAVADVRFRNGKLTFLSDLEPIDVEEVGYFGRIIHWRRDQGFDESPAKIRGAQPSRCLSMHSRSVLTYALDGHYDRFRAKLAFDDSAGKRGRAACRVLVDGRELFGEKDLRSTQDPVEIDVALAGAKQLALEVDFGEGEDVGDRIVWAEPRLFRAVPH